MKRRPKKSMENLHLVGKKLTDFADVESKNDFRYQGMSHIQIGGVDAESGEEFSMCIWQPTELLDKIIMRDYEMPEQLPPICPAPKVKTNVIDLQPYRDEKEMLELSRKAMAILFDR